MPILSAQGGASARAYGFAKVDLGGGYWAAVLNANSTQTQYHSIFIDNNSKACYQTYTLGYGATPQATIVKLKSDGTFDWQRTYSVTLPSANTLPGGGTDSSGNVYFGGVQNSYPNNKTFLLKTDSSGNLSVQTIWNNGSFSSVLGRSLALNPGGAQVVLASTDTNGTLNPQVALFDNSYNQGSVGYWNGSGNQGYGSVLMPDQGRLSTWGSAPQFMLNSNNTLRWGVTTGSGLIGSACTNINGQLFAIPNGSASGSEVGEINASSGALVWAKRLASGYSSQDNVGVTANNSHVYNLMYGSGGGQGEIYISKRSATTGALQWQRKFSSSTSGYQDLRVYYPYLTNGQTICVDSADANLYVSFYIEGPANSKQVQFIWKLPTDGSKTGTYTVNGVSITYAASTLTDSTITPTRTTTSATITSGSAVQTAGGSGSLSNSQYVSPSKVVIP